MPAQAARFIVGLDVGQISDPTALAVLERRIGITQGVWDVSFDVRYLERVPLRTPYPAMVRGVRERLEKLGEPCLLVIDATGVGRGVVDLFREGWTVYEETELPPGALRDRQGWPQNMPPSFERRTLPGKPPVIALTLTGGTVAHADPHAWDDWTVPKREVIGAVAVLLQQQRLRVARALPHAETLVKEAQNFQWKVSPTGLDQYGAWREGQHDDVLLAVAIAAWWGKQTAPKPRKHAPVREPAYVGPHAWMG